MSFNAAILTGLHHSTAFSPDGATAYFADSPSREIWAFDYNTQQGRIQGVTQRVFANIPEPGVRTSGRAVFRRVLPCLTRRVVLLLSD